MQSRGCLYRPLKPYLHSCGEPKIPIPSVLETRTKEEQKFPTEQSKYSHSEGVKMKTERLRVDKSQ